MRFWVSSTCIALVTWGCGPKPETKAPPQAVEAPATVVAEAPDLSPVKRPPEVVVLGRIARPKVLVDTFTRWSSLPVTLDDLLPEPAKPLSRAVLWDAPIDMVVALDNFGEGKVPRPLMIGSVGLKSLEAALSAADAMQLPTRKLTAGVYRFGDSTDVSCVVAMSLGTAPARLVCGYGPKDVDTLLPYATRGLPTEPQSGSDFELTLDAGPIQERYGRDVTALRLFAGMAIREVALDSPRFDRALSDAVYGVVDDTINLFNDLDRIRIEAHVDAARNMLVGSTELKLKGQSSWLAGTLAATKPQPIPADLPRLPPGATLAAYNPALPSERYVAITRILGELASGWLEHEKFPEAARKRARHLVDAMFAKQPESFAFAMSPTQADAIGYRHSDTVVVRASEPAERMLGVYSDFFSLLGDPGLKTWIKQTAKLKMNDKVAGAVTKLWPKLAKKPFKLAGFKAPATLFEVTVDLKAWSEVDETVARAIDSVLKGETKELKRLDIIVQPDGDHTWVVTGDDTKEMARVVAEQQKSGPGAFFARPQHDQKVALAGFVTLSYVAHAIARSAKSEKVMQAFSGAPHRGETPITFASGVGPGSVHVDVEVPADAFSDITAAAIRGGADLKDAFDKVE
jgi:hypothetical protein